MRLEYMIELAAPGLAAYLSVELIYCMNFDSLGHEVREYIYTEAPRAFGLNKPPALVLPRTKNSRYTTVDPKNSDKPDPAST